MDIAAMGEQNVGLLNEISSSCLEIQQCLKEHLATTTSPQYKAHIEQDIVTLENLKLITVAVKADIASGTIGASTELLLRIAANDFKKKLAQIPEKKNVRERIGKALKEVHRGLLRMAPGALVGGRQNP